MSDSKCTNCGDWVLLRCELCQPGGSLGDASQNAAATRAAQNAAAMIDPVKAREMMEGLRALPQSLPEPAPVAGPRREVRGTERRLRSLAREAIRCAVRSITLTRKDDGNRVDTAVLKRALEAYAEFQDALDPQTFIAILDGEDE